MPGKKPTSVYRKKRAKVFNKKKDTTAVQPATVTTRPSPVTTASRKKLALSSPHLATSGLSTSADSEVLCVPSTAAGPSDIPLGECVAGREMHGYRFMSCKQLDAGLQKIGRCCSCSSPLQLTESFSKRKGLVSKISIVCSNPECLESVTVSDPSTVEATNLNVRSVLGMRMIGCGRTKLDTYMACMEMLPPLSPSAWTDYNRHVQVAIDKCALNSQVEAAKHLHQLNGVSPDDVVDVRVSVDGTWSKRGGYTALYGVVVVAAWETGQVLDYEILSKHCAACAKHESTDHESSEYKEWVEDHKDSCDLNYSGSSPAMEVEGVRRIWLRSIAKLKLRYTSFISDGDSKGYLMLLKLQPYGQDVEIVKHECVGHVQKRMGAAFRKLRASKPTLSDGSPAKISGRFTAKTMDALQVYYGGAIRDHASVEEMQKAIWASFYHCISPPQHHLCPTGEESWCKHNYSLAMSEEPPEPDPKIPEDLVEVIKPTYKRLAEKELLERCVLGATQNQNESFNNLVWSRCSKTSFCGLPSVQSAVGLAVIIFNDGMHGLKQLMVQLGQESGPRSSWFFNHRDEDRIRSAEKQNELVARRRRKYKRRTKAAAEEKKIEHEGMTYGAGEF